MKALALLLLAVPAYACDWKSVPQTNPMVDGAACLISSESAKLSLYVDKDAVRLIPHSKLRHHSLMVRVDDRPAILIGENASTGGFRDNARVALAQIRAGQRIRTQFLSYPHHESGESEVCSLPSLIDSCLP